jgi:Lrp/AsnC family transcriptional regulator
LPRSATASVFPQRHAGSESSGWRRISVFVSVESADHSEAWLQKFAEAVSAMPEVMEFYRMAGDVDYMLRVVAADMQSYDVFYKKLISAVPLKNVTSRFAMEKIKSVTALPVPAN